MNRTLLHGGPPRGPRSSYGSQDARSSSNLAVQPTASPTNFSLKKATAKVARPAGPVQSSPSTPRAGPVNTTPKVEDGHETSKPAASVTATPPVALETATSSHDDAESAIDKLFARLTTKEPSNDAESAIDELYARLNSTAQPSPTPKSTTVPRESPSTPEVKGRQTPSPGGLVAIKEEPVENVEMSPALEKQEERSLENPLSNPSSIKSEAASPHDVEREYRQKASKYLTLVPVDKASTADLVKNVIIKLRRPYAPSAKLEPDAVEGLKARYLDAMAAHLKGLHKAAQPVTKDHIEDTLVKGEGDFLYMCAEFVEEGLITIENLDDVVGLCKAIMSTLPNDKDAAPPTAAASKSTNSSGPGNAFQDPLEGLKSWPTREKREKAAEYRTCMLKGVSGISSINQLQALVWGGRLESLQLPQPGTTHATVKFLTAESCQKYFKATENGIIVPGDKKNVIFVEKTPGPNSTNDNIRNCAEGDASRCVRALGADDDWSDMVLLKLARGKGQSKREVDRIKRGKAAQGRFYIEFRFANIYSALQFKRELMDDMEWEHCNIVYAPDPCETAQGVHFREEDESEKSGGFY